LTTTVSQFAISSPPFLTFSGDFFEPQRRRLGGQGLAVQIIVGSITADRIGQTLQELSWWGT